MVLEVFAIDCYMKRGGFTAKLVRASVHRSRLGDLYRQTRKKGGPTGERDDIRESRGREKLTRLAKSLQRNGR